MFTTGVTLLLCGVFFWVFACGVLCGVLCGSTPTWAQQQHAPTKPAITQSGKLVPTRSYTVQPGDTLSSIAERELGHRDFAQWILKLNPEVKDADRILAGYPLLLPMPDSADPSQEFWCGDTAAVPPPPAPVPAVSNGDPGRPRPASSTPASSTPAASTPATGGEATVTPKTPNSETLAVPEGFLVSANIAPAASSDGEAPFIRGVARQLREIPATLGVVGVGLGLLVAAAVLFDLIVFLLLGGLALWIGATVVRVPEISFGRAFAVNAVGALTSVVVAAVLWGGMLGFAMSDAGAPYMPQQPEQWLVWFMVSLLLVTGLQALAYTTLVWRAFGTTFLRSVFACAVTILVQVGLSGATAILAVV